MTSTTEITVLVGGKKSFFIAFEGDVEVRTKTYEPSLISKVKKP